MPSCKNKLWKSQSSESRHIEVLVAEFRAKHAECSITAALPSSTVKTGLPCCWRNTHSTCTHTLRLPGRQHQRPPEISLLLLWWKIYTVISSAILRPSLTRDCFKEIARLSDFPSSYLGGCQTWSERVDVHTNNRRTRLLFMLLLICTNVSGLVRLPRLTGMLKLLLNWLFHSSLGKTTQWALGARKYCIILLEFLNTAQIHVGISVRDNNGREKNHARSRLKSPAPNQDAKFWHNYAAYTP